MKIFKRVLAVVLFATAVFIIGYLVYTGVRLHA